MGVERSQLCPPCDTGSVFESGLDHVKRHRAEGKAQEAHLGLLGLLRPLGLLSPIGLLGPYYSLFVLLFNCCLVYC